MGLINAKCPECGAVLKINEQAKGELRCPYCGSTYLAENAVHITNISNTTINDNSTNITASNVNIEMPKANYKTIEIGYCFSIAIKNRAVKKMEPGYMNIFINGERIGKVGNYQTLEYPIDMSKPATINIVHSDNEDCEKTIVLGPGIQMETNLILFTREISKYSFLKSEYEVSYWCGVASQDELTEFYEKQKQMFE